MEELVEDLLFLSRRKEDENQIRVAILGRPTLVNPPVSILGSNAAGSEIPEPPVTR
jgi:hypothetical protein